MTLDELLKKCLAGRTQNPNESFHSKIWAKCSKAKFHGYDLVKFITQINAVDYNVGYEQGSLLSALGFITTDTIYAAKCLQDKKQLSE